MSQSILVVDDEPDHLAMVCRLMGDAGTSVEAAESAEKALDVVSRKPIDLVVTDLKMPGMDGLSLAEKLLEQDPNRPVILMTAHADLESARKAVAAGLYDYVTKPFSLSELVARVRSALRRIRLTSEEARKDEPVREIFEFPGIKIDAARRRVDVKGSEINLTVLEYDLLLFLVRNPDRPFTRLQLLDKVWDIQYEGYDRTVDSHIQRLRSKIEDDQGNPRFIKTVWGVGYKFQTEGNGG